LRKSEAEDGVVTVVLVAVFCPVGGVVIVMFAGLISSLLLLILFNYFYFFSFSFLGVVVVFAFEGDENEVSGDMVRCWCCGVGLAPKGFWCWWL
jgi:hypothetical protein